MSTPIFQQCLAKVVGLILFLSIPLVSISTVNAETSLTRMFPALVGVTLTSTQEQQLEELANRSIPQLKKTLSSEQQLKFDRALTEGKGVRRAILSLNLPLSQKLSQRQLLETLRSQMDRILTPKQQQQVMQNVNSLQQQGK